MGVLQRLGVTATCAVLAVGLTGCGSSPPGGGADSTVERQESVIGQQPAHLPVAGHLVFAHHRILVAYYGTAHTSGLGVLGSAPPNAITKRLRAAALPFATPKRKVQIVYELVASVADSYAGSDRDYSHYIPRSYVEEYVRAARRHHALLVLDLQPGRSSFLPQARHFRWALRRPFVGMALDPEWRMGPHQVPAQTIGHVKAAEVNQVSQFVAAFTRRHHLPQKLFLIHQFTTSMVRHIGRVRKHGVLAMVQHVDGFGSRRAKLTTYHNVAKPKRFHMGFKLFYKQDSHLFSPRDVRRIRPRIDFVSYQ